MTYPTSNRTIITLADLLNRRPQRLLGVVRDLPHHVTNVILDATGAPSPTLARVDAIVRAIDLAEMHGQRVTIVGSDRSWLTVIAEADLHHRAVVTPDIERGLAYS